MTPQIVAKKVYRGSKVESVYGPISLLSSVDARLSDKAHRILCVITACSWKTRVPLSFDEIAEAAFCSRRSAIRHINALQKTGYLEVEKRHNHRNQYKLAKIQPAAVNVADNASKKPLKVCPECHVVCKSLGRTGLCRGCAEKVDLRTKIRHAQAELGPEATAEEIAVHLKHIRLATKIRRIMESAA